MGVFWYVSSFILLFYPIIITYFKIMVLVLSVFSPDSFLGSVYTIRTHLWYQVIQVLNKSISQLVSTAFKPIVPFMYFSYGICFLQLVKTEPGLNPIRFSAIMVRRVWNFNQSASRGSVIKFQHPIALLLNKFHKHHHLFSSLPWSHI